MRLLGPLHGVGQARAEFLRHFVRPLLGFLLDLVGECVEPVLAVNLLALPFVIRRIGLGVLHHLVDLAVRQAARCFDTDLLLLAGGLVLGRHVENTVRVNVKRDFHLRHAARGRRNPRELELADRLVVDGEFALALEHMNLNRRLVVVGGGEGF